MAGCIQHRSCPILPVPLLNWFMGPLMVSAEAIQTAGLGSRLRECLLRECLLTPTDASSRMVLPRFLLPWRGTLNPTPTLESWLYWVLKRSRRSRYETIRRFGSEALRRPHTDYCPSSMGHMAFHVKYVA